MKIAAAILGTVIVGVTLSIYWYLNISSSWKGTAKDRLEMFSTEEEAAPAATQKPPPGPPVATVAKGEEVTVVWDTYGKDYWACYVRTSQGKRGWIMCPDLQRS